MLDPGLERGMTGTFRTIVGTCEAGEFMSIVWLYSNLELFGSWFVSLEYSLVVCTSSISEWRDATVSTVIFG